MPMLDDITGTPAFTSGQPSIMLEHALVENFETGGDGCQGSKNF